MRAGDPRQETKAPLPSIKRPSSLPLPLFFFRLHSRPPLSLLLFLSHLGPDARL